MTRKGMKQRIEDKRVKSTRPCPGIYENHASGTAAELEVCGFFLLQGYQVFRNVATFGPDLIVRKNGKSRVVEVRFSKYHENRKRVSTPNNMCDYAFYVFPEAYLLIVVETDERKWFSRPTVSFKGETS